METTMVVVETMLYPIIAMMTALLNFFFGMFNSYGLAIIFVSAVIRIILYPIIKYTGRIEKREQLIQLKMAPELAVAKANYTGRERFEAIDEIYQKYGYHPIKSLSSLAPLLLQIPFLLSALFLLTKYPPLVGEPFLFIEDISQPDGLLQIGSSLAINLLPIALTVVAVIDSAINPLSTNQARMRFLVISIVLLVLIYPLPAAVNLYWFSSICWSIIGTIYYRSQQKDG